MDDFGIKWYDVKNPPFEVYGLADFQLNGQFRRMPKTVAETISEKVKKLSLNTSGGRVRFATDSRRIAISVKYSELNVVPTMPLVATSGFDIYIENENRSEFLGAFKPKADSFNGYEAVVELPSSAKNGLNYFTVNFPLRNEVENLLIGVDDGSVIEKGLKYRDVLPIVYYGSSITQGTSASRPGATYESIICRQNNCDYYNFGFSNGALGEKKMAEYLSKFKMSVFVCDYDHNSPNPEELKRTHKEFYKIFRKANPTTPYIMITRPDGYKNTADTEMRRKAIFENYSEAVFGGDNNLYFIDGNAIFSAVHYSNCTVDTIHPNDLGFWLMAEAIGEKINELL